LNFFKEIKFLTPAANLLAYLNSCRQSFLVIGIFTFGITAFVPKKFLYDPVPKAKSSIFTAADINKIPAIQISNPATT
jgi:hypothetical protein